MNALAVASDQCRPNGSCKYRSPNPGTAKVKWLKMPSPRPCRSAIRCAAAISTSTCQAASTDAGFVAWVDAKLMMARFATKRLSDGRDEGVGTTARKERGAPGQPGG